MPTDFKGLYEFHGHKCPMSTMGARLGSAAMTALGVTKADQFQIKGVYKARNCALDGIQYVTGCTLGNGNLEFTETGVPSLVLARRDGRKSVTVSASEGAMERFAGHKKLRAELEPEREISGLARAMEIDALLKAKFDALVEWVQSAPDDELVDVAGENTGGDR